MSAGTVTSHRRRHLALIDGLDELIKDYLLHHQSEKRVRRLVDPRLLAWARMEAEHPTAPPAGEHHHNGHQFIEDDDDGHEHH